MDNINTTSCGNVDYALIKEWLKAYYESTANTEADRGLDHEVSRRAARLDDEALQRRAEPSEQPSDTSSDLFNEFVVVDTPEAEEGEEPAEVPEPVALAVAIEGEIVLDETPPFDTVLEAAPCLPVAPQEAILETGHQISMSPVVDGYSRQPALAIVHHQQELGLPLGVQTQHQQFDLPRSAPYAQQVSFPRADYQNRLYSLPANVQNVGQQLGPQPGRHAYTAVPQYGQQSLYSSPAGLLPGQQYRPSSGLSTGQQYSSSFGPRIEQQYVQQVGPQYGPVAGQLYWQSGMGQQYMPAYNPLAGQAVAAVGQPVSYPPKEPAVPISRTKQPPRPLKPKRGRKAQAAH